MDESFFVNEACGLAIPNDVVYSAMKGYRRAIVSRYGTPITRPSVRPLESVYSFLTSSARDRIRRSVATVAEWVKNAAVVIIALI